MSNRFLISVAAAALIAGTGFANAQGTGMSREAPAQSAAPSEKGAPSAAPMNRNDASGSKSMDSKGADSGMKSTQSDEKMAPGGAKNQRVQDAAPAQKSKMSSDNEKAGASKDMKADGKTGGMDSKTGTTNAQTKSTDTKSQTTGNAATSATGAPPVEKRTQIVSAIKSEKIQETTNVNFNISVGTAIPASVHFHPLPPRIVEIYPEWRGYEVIYVRGQYVIVRPQTREIVYIIEG